MQVVSVIQCHLCCNAGPAAEEQKVYLSAATLLVLPATLIPHWLHQIKTHLAPATLRVAVVTSEASQRGPADASEQGLHALPDT